MTIALGEQSSFLNGCKLSSNPTSNFTLSSYHCPLQLRNGKFILISTSLMLKARRELVSMASIAYDPIKSVWSCILESTQCKLMAKSSLLEQSVHSFPMMLKIHYYVCHLQCQLKFYEPSLPVAHPRCHGKYIC